MNERKHYLDWLKAVAIWVLVIAHIFRIMDYPSFYVKHGQHLWADLSLRFLDLWFMPLFFVIGGMAAYHSIEKRGLQKFKKDRARRLLLPFVVSLFTILPITGYFAYLAHYPASELNFFAYYPKFFQFNVKQLQGFTGNFTPGHLWYLVFVYLFSVWSGPIFHRIEDKGMPLKSRQFPLLFAIGCLTFSKLTALPYPNPLYFWAYFCLGYAISSQKFEFAIFSSLQKRPLLVLAVTIAMTVWMSVLRVVYLPQHGPVWLYFAMQPVYCTTALLWVLILLYYAQKYFNTTNSVLQYLNNMAIYVYIVHMPFVVFYGYLFSNKMTAPVAFFANLFCSYISLFVLYELVVRHIPPLRALFGITDLSVTSIFPLGVPRSGERTSI
ncbi:MAG: acyltransferase family protein [Spirochaetota bacterium]